jgi:hypothetical protein
MTENLIEHSDKHNSLSAYQALVYNIFQLPRNSHRGLAIAITSPTRGTGTSHLARSLTHELGNHPANRILLVDLTAIARTINSSEEIPDLVKPTANPTIFEIPMDVSKKAPAGSSSFWHSSTQHRRDCIEYLRDHFQYILFDCPALRESGDTLGIASLVDGLLLIVEADRTTKAEIFQAERQIETAGGRLYGNILNKRKYLVPDWVRRRL